MVKIHLDIKLDQKKFHHFDGSHIIVSTTDKQHSKNWFIEPVKLFILYVSHNVLYILHTCEKIISIHF